MKRPTGSLPDVDLRGRVRHHPQPEKKTQQIRLVDGPFIGTKGLDIDTLVQGDEIEYAGMRWTWAGKKLDGRRIFAKKPTERGVWKFMLYLIGMNGKDPRLQERRRPFVHTDATRPVKHGRGRLRREAARV